MKTLFSIVTLLFFSQLALAQDVSAELKKLDAKIRGSKSLQMKFTNTVLDLNTGQEVVTQNEFLRLNNKYLSKNGAITTVQDENLKVVIESEGKKIMLSDPSPLKLEKGVEFEPFLENCESMKMTDTLGMKNIVLNYGSNSSISRINIRLKNDLPEQIVIDLSNGEDKYQVKISYQTIKINTGVAAKRFNTSKYVKLNNKDAQLTPEYKDYKLYNLIRH